MKNVEAVCRLLDSIEAPYALIGGHAVSVRGYPRMTVDYDLLTSDPRVLTPAVWSPLERSGAAVDVRTGDFDDPLAGVVHVEMTDGTSVDVIVAKYRWQHEVITRSEVLDVGGLRVPVPRTSDLILLKLAAGGFIDLQDVAVLLAVEQDRQSVVGEVEERIAMLGADGLTAWRRVLSELR